MLIKCLRTEPCRHKAQKWTIIPWRSPEMLATQELHRCKTLLGKTLLWRLCGEKNHARNDLKLREWLNFVLQSWFFFLESASRGRKPNKIKQKKKIVEKATFIFMPRRKLGCFSRLWLILDSPSNASRLAWQVGLWPLVASSPTETRYLLSHVPWVTPLTPSCVFDLMCTLSSGPAPTHISMAEDLCTARASHYGATMWEQVSGSGDPLFQSYHGRSCPAAVSSALPFPLCFLPFFTLAESCCESKRVNSHLLEN